MNFLKPIRISIILILKEFDDDKKIVIIKKRNDRSNTFLIVKKKNNNKRETWNKLFLFKRWFSIWIKKKSYHIFAYRIIREFVWRIFNDSIFLKKRFSISKMIHSFHFGHKDIELWSKAKCIQSMDAKWSKTTDWLSLRHENRAFGCRLEFPRVYRAFKLTSIVRWNGWWPAFIE